MFNNPFAFEGRIRRTELALSYLLIYAVAFIVGLTLESSELYIIIIPLLLIPAMWFILAQNTKRCHDRGNSGWYQIIPFYDLWMIFGDSDNGFNKYGPNPKGVGNQATE